MRMWARQLVCASLTLGATSSTASAQQLTLSAAEQPTICDLPIPPPAKNPPPGTPPIVFQIVPCFSAQGNVPMVEAGTYLYYIHTSVSRPSQDQWVPYDSTTAASVRDDFKRLWDTGFLEDLSIEAVDYHFPNGVIGKMIVYHLEERQRVKIITYEGAKHLEQSKLEDRLRDLSLVLKIDTFVDQQQIQKIKTVAKSMLAEQGFQDARVITELQVMPGGPKLVHLKFVIDEGPQTKIKRVEFDGNKAIADRTLGRAMRHNRARRLFPIPHLESTYKEEGFEDDAQRITGFYRDRGYVSAHVGEPALRTLADSADGKTRWVSLTIPVSEGIPYRVGEFTIDGAASVKTDYLLSLFKLQSGDIYSDKRIRDGLAKMRELYGALGRFEFTGYPDLAPRGDTTDPRVDVTLRVQEGERFFINRISFRGNTSTKDNVIRRELQVYEAGVLNMEALKLSIRRLNQLGYFKPLDEQKGVTLEKLPGSKDKVDLTLNLEEQNRNQLSFGAGVSEVNGLFVNGSFSTTNFLGKGETLSVAIETGFRSNSYQAGLTEPYVFNRPISLGINLFTRKTNYYFLSATTPSYSEVREGATGTSGWNLRNFTRLFAGYTYEVIDTLAGEEMSTAAAEPVSSRVTTTTTLTTATGGTSTVTTTQIVPPTIDFSIDNGRHVESRIEPNLVFNTVDNPFTPRRGRRLNLDGRIAGGALGGTVNYWRPEAELIWYIPFMTRTALGLRGQVGYLRPYGITDKLPYYLRYFLGGEYQIRGTDLRTVGPINDSNQLVGGNKFLLFNAEYYIDIAGPVRALVFHDAGQAYDETQRLNLRQLRTSTGAELRVVVPMLNVPFRLIYAWNFYRDEFQKPRTFKFAVGTTF